MANEYERLWRRVEPGWDSDCWEWRGSVVGHGYGQLVTGSRTDGSRRVRKTHRLSYEFFHGPVPDGLCVLHACDNPPCVNPSHLWLGTQADNQVDMARKGRSRNRHTAGRE